MLPLLAFGADGNEKNIRDAIEIISQQAGLTDEERNRIVPSGGQTVVSNRIHWARTYLDKAGALVRTRRAHFRVTDRGLSLLEKYPNGIDAKILHQFPEFVAFKAPETEGEGAGQETAADTSSIEHSATPDERVTSAISEINEKLESELLARIAENSPTFFERLVVDLIVAMGYGGSKEHVVQRVKTTGDEGIDGIVNEDPLGLDVVYVQAKRYASDQTIGRDKIQQFAGALVGQGAGKGVFFATCGYSKAAIEYAHRVPQKIILINGSDLARLLIKYGVGVRTEREIILKRLDLDYFEESEE
jgi:restriction system protein